MPGRQSTFGDSPSPSTVVDKDAFPDLMGINQYPMDRIERIIISLVRFFMINLYPYKNSWPQGGKRNA
jgi:hypothetical protein